MYASIPAGWIVYLNNASIDEYICILKAFYSNEQGNDKKIIERASVNWKKESDKCNR